MPVIGCTVFPRCHTGLPVKNRGKVTLAWKGKGSGYHGNGIVGVKQHIAGSLQLFIQNISADAATGFLFEKPA